MTSTDPQEIFGQRMRRRREDLDISLRDLAERMQHLGHGWHPTTVARTETADRPVRLSEAVDLAGILRMPLTDLLRPVAGGAGGPELNDSIDEVIREIGKTEAVLNRARYLRDAADEKRQEAARELASAEKSSAVAAEVIEHHSLRLDELNGQLAALRDSRAEDIRHAWDMDVHRAASMYASGTSIGRISLILGHSERDIWEMLKVASTQGAIPIPELAARVGTPCAVDRSDFALSQVAIDEAAADVGEIAKMKPES